MLYRVLAESVLLIHLLFIAFALLGGFLVIRWRPVAFLHLPCLAWAVYIELAGGICPLTPLENRLRRLAGDAGYDGGFIEHYLIPILYPPGLTPTVQLAIAIILLTLNTLAYTLVWRKHRVKARIE